ncbi:MAG: hypothetical protein H0U73_02200 [Tatlockia sp.]|nr:hypothetical protein [Tatlockia sp.]
MSTPVQILPLSKPQQRVWLEWKAMPESVAYNNPLLYQLRGQVNVDLLTQALQYVVDLQPALRCSFIEQSGLPRQILTTKLAVKLDYEDFSNFPEEERQTLIQKAIAGNVGKSFALDQLPLFRFTLICIAENEYFLILNIHHIVVDGHSAQILIQTISDYYNQNIVTTEPFDLAYINYLNKTPPDQIENEQFWASQFENANFISDLYTEANHHNLDAEGIGVLQAS